MLGPGNARRQMGEDEVVPAVMRDHPIGGGEIDADRPFLVADLALRATGFRSIRAAWPRHSPVDAVDAVHAALSWRSGWAAANGVERAGVVVGAKQGRIVVERHRRTAAHCRAAGPGRGRPPSARCRTGNRRPWARPSLPARSGPRGPNGHTSGRSRPAAGPSSFLRYLSTRKLLSGWMSQATIIAMAATWARSGAMAGISGGVGKRASR